MKKDIVQELKWRGMIHDMIPGTEEQLQKEMTTVYVGFDPTSDSLHIGHLVSVFLLKHLQNAGHKPIALLGGATGMIGDPSGKSEERNLLNEEELRHNEKCLKEQMKTFFDFNDNLPNKAEIMNNYDWMKDYSFLSFLRKIGKHLNINYMMAKDSVKKRLETGLSFTEFSYQLIQAYDFYYLNTEMNCKLQMGGSDQWGNITSGCELIRKMSGEDVFALTCPLITKADGNKFGKSESGNIWLDAKKTSPYKFYQFWLNLSDEDVEKFIKIFTFLSQYEINVLSEEHNKAPHLRILQKKLAEEITKEVHGEDYLEHAKEASAILFGKGTTESLKKLTTEDFLNIFEGVPQIEIKKDLLKEEIGIIDFLSTHTNIFKSKGEARKMLKNNGVSINKEKIDEKFEITLKNTIQSHYILVQKGKKNYFIIKIV